MKQDINKQIAVIENSIAWSKKFGKKTFPVEELKEYRRKLKRIANALEENCSAAAYGESQVGKSYLMSSLLSTADTPFIIANEGKEYSYIDALNPSGGNTSQTESTGVITRFTINCDNEAMKDFVKIKNLSVSDLIMLLVDSYYNDLKLDNDKALESADINAELTKIQSLWVGKSEPVQNVLTEDDVKDICDYIEEVIGSNTVHITRSDFRKVVSSNIQYISYDNWVKVFSILWNNSKELSFLFSTLINEYKKINFETDVYVPFEAVLRDKGTLLKIEWLDSVCGLPHNSETDILTTDVYKSNGDLLATNFNKSSLSALIAELTFVLPSQIANERQFLKKIDLLDFPGARSREKFKEQEIADVLPRILRRGKVAYLFNKYSRSLRISSVLFCHHNDQKSEPSLGETINSWIETNIGQSPEERAEALTGTNGISPLFLIATKFNKELKRTSNDLPDNPEMLAEHWKRFKTVLPEIIKPATWFDKWVTQGGLFSSEAFQSIYLLRDFYWSMETRVFEGYDSKTKAPETKRVVDQDYPNFFENLTRSFLENDFVKTHFADPKKSWDEVSSLNSDGSKAIIRDLDYISVLLDNARRNKYQKELKAIREEIVAKLNTYYEPEDKEENNKKTRNIVGKIRRSLDSNIGRKPETFGRIIDHLMIPVSDIRKIAYDIVILRTEVPKDLNEISLIRTQAKINPSDDRDVNIKKLCQYYACDIEELESDFAKEGFSVEDVVSNECNVLTTVADVVSNRVLEYWDSFINKQVSALEKYIPYPDEVAFMLQNLCKNLGVQRKISEKIDRYSKVFPESDLPNAISDYVSLTINNFVSSVGYKYMSDSDKAAIRKKAQSINIDIDLPQEASEAQRKNTNVIEALQAFDDAADSSSVSHQTLMKLPFWDNFQRWKNLLIIGILYSADVSHCDPVANAEMKNIIDKCSNLFQN